MGFNKRYINYQNTLAALKSDNLKGYYGKSDTFIFEDEISEKIYRLFITEKKKEQEILNIINQ
jgi:hypothetical protein